MFGRMTLQGKIVVTLFVIIVVVGVAVSCGPAIGSAVNAGVQQVKGLLPGSLPSPSQTTGQTIPAVGIPPVPVATQAPAGQQAQPTVRATQPAGATTVPAQPPAVITQAAAAAAACQGKPEVDVDTIVFAPYTLWLLPSIYGTDCKNGVKLNYLMLDVEEQLLPWALSTPPDKYFPPLSADVQKDKRYSLRKDATGKSVTRLQLTTQNSCIFYGDCRVVDVLGRSDGNDAIVVSSRANPPINNWDDISFGSKRPYLGGAVGNVNEFAPKAMSWACGYTPAGDFQPRLTTEKAGQDFVERKADVASLYEPYVSIALEAMKGDARVAVSSKSFIGIIDVVLTSKDSDPAIVSKAILATSEAMTQAFNSRPEDVWQKLYDWAYGPNGTDERQAILGYTKFEDWWGDMQREALFSPKDKVYAFGAGKGILVERLRQAQGAFTLTPTFHSQNLGAFFPASSAPGVYLDPAVFVDSRPMDLIKSDPRMQATAKVPNDNLQFVTFAPSTTGTKALSNLPTLSIQFQGGQAPAEFVNAATAQQELATKVLQCLKLFKVNLRLTAASDDVALDRATRVRTILTRNLGVPEGKIVIVRQNNLPAGTVQFAIVGNEE